ncbi:MAG: hypothetical protein ACRCXC_09915 [Legionella sp.]
MVNQLFNRFIFKSAEVSEDNASNPSLIYGATALYFTEDNSTEETSLQLKNFQESHSYTEFKTQYETLLHALNHWCQKHSIRITENVEEKRIPAFFLFQKRLLGSQDYYSTRKGELFYEGKRALE